MLVVLRLLLVEGDLTLLASTVDSMQERRLVELVLPSQIGAMASFRLLSRVHKVVDPIVLEVEFVRVEAFRLGDHFYLLVVVRSTSISCNNSSFEVGMHEVCTAVVLDGLLLFLMRAFLALDNLCAVELLESCRLDGRRITLSSSQCSTELIGWHWRYSASASVVFGITRRQSS